MALRPVGGVVAEAAVAGELLPATASEAAANEGAAATVAEADTLRGEQRLVGELRARSLQSQFEPQGVQTSAQAQQEKAVEFRVEVPKNGDAREMRNAILKGPPFHYTDADIRALEQSTTGEEFYIYSGSNSERWATPAEVKRFSVVDGKTTIPVRESLVNSLVAFRARRRVEQATAGITDPALRQQVSEQLFTVLTARGSQGVQAAVVLAALADANTPGAVAVTDAIRKAADDPAGRQNAALQLALARASVSDELSRRAVVYGPYNDEADFSEARTRALEAVRLAGGLDPATGLERPGAVVNREEAALLNKYAAQVFRQAGDESGATQREMIGRFYESDEQERRTSSLTVYPTIPRWKPDDTPSVRPVTEEERRLAEFDAEFRATQQTPPPRDPALERAKDAQRRGEYRIMNDGTLQRRVAPTEDKGEVYTGRTQTERERERNGELFRRRVYTEQQVNPRGVERGAARAGAVDLVNTGLTYYGLYRKTQELERYQAAREPLQADVNRATRYPVPPEPEEVERIASALREARARETDPQRRAQIEETLRFIPTMREASRAFWNR